MDLDSTEVYYISYRITNPNPNTKITPNDIFM